MKKLKSDRQQCYLCFISEYVNDISYIKGSQDIVADSLSRPANTFDVCNLQEIRKHQATDEKIETLSDHLKPYNINKDETILCDVSL